jgi:hypothetical protein
MAAKVNTPVRFWIIAILLVLWEAGGCYACVTQFRLGAAAMGPVDDWSLKYYAALPVWYNWVYAVATFGDCWAVWHCCFANHGRGCFSGFRSSRSS